MRIQLDHSLQSIALVVAATALLLFVGTGAMSIGVLAAAPDPAAAEPEAPATRRCPACGWIESGRQIPGGADNRAIRIQEYTVRMVDGSSRMFHAGPGDHWRVGERMTFIDGSAR
jgi:hypothetical protein